MAGGGSGGGNSEGKDAVYQKSYFDVLGICCPSEVPLIEKILNSLDGVKTVSVIVPSRTVIVVHDSLLVSQLQIVRALNQARLEATVRAYGSGAARVRNWPSPYTLACGVLLALSFLKSVYHPMKYLAVGAVAVGILPILLRSVAAVRRLTVDVNILMLIAVAGSLALRDFWEAGTIVFLFTTAEWLESRATYKATAVMSSLMSMAPQKAILAESGLAVEAKDVMIGTVLAVKAGEVVPIDGTVVEGRCEVDESSLTGESFPVAKQPLSLVWAGTHNINGYISVKTTALAENSAVAKMTKLVEEAQNSKSKINRMIDSCAKYYTPAIVLAAALVAMIPAAMKVHNMRHWLQLALVLLVSACPCALVLSTPVATFCALTRAAKTGLLIKGGDFLEALAKTKVIAFDKTGTITRGEFTVMDFRPLRDGVPADILLYWVSSIESKSSHPMATALVDHAQSNSVEAKPDNVIEFQIFPGEGICGEIDGRIIYVGNRRIASRAGCKSEPNVEEEMKGVTVGYVISGAELIGLFSLSDTCRTGAAEAIKELKHMGTKTVMLTGDSSAAASHAQNQLGNLLDVVHAELLPVDKVRIVNELKSKEGHTVMVGDGLNDAPALTAASVGISMGISGSAVAMETSHITLMSNDVRKIPEAIRLAKKTRLKIIENIVLSITTKVAILALAFAGHPLLWAAVLADVGTCLLVILNSMLLLRTKRGRGKKCCKSSHASHGHGVGDHHHHHHHHHHGVGVHCEVKDSCHRPIDSNAESCCSHEHGGGHGHEHKSHHESKHSATNGRIAEDSGYKSDVKGENCCSHDSAEELSCHRSIPAATKSCCSHDAHKCEADEEKGHGSNCGDEDCHAPDALHHDECFDDCPEEGIHSHKLTHWPSVEHLHGSGGKHDENCHSQMEEGLHNKCCTQRKNLEHIGRCRGIHRKGDPVCRAIACSDQQRSVAVCRASACSDQQQRSVAVYRRDLGGCCTSYRDECRRMETCCGGYTPQLTEIVTE